MRYNLLNILTVMMLVVGSEQLLGRQHLNVLLLSFPSASLNVIPPLGLYRLILAGLVVLSQRRGLVLQLRGFPLVSTHSPPDKVVLGNAHFRGE